MYLAEHFQLREVAEYWRSVLRINGYQQRRLAVRMVRSLFNTVAGKKITVFGFAYKAQTSDFRLSPALEVCRVLLEDRARLTVCDPHVDPAAAFAALREAVARGGSGCVITAPADGGHGAGRAGRHLAGGGGKGHGAGAKLGAKYGTGKGPGRDSTPGPVTDEQMKAAEASVNAQSLEFTRDPYAAAAGAHALVVLTEWPQFKTLDYKLLFYFMQKPAFLFDYRGILDAPALRSIGFSVVTVGQGTPSS